MSILWRNFNFLFLPNDSRSDIVLLLSVVLFWGDILMLTVTNSKHHEHHLVFATHKSISVFYSEH